MLERKKACNLLNQYLPDNKLIKHSIAVEKIMIALATKLDQDKELWGITGLLHDLDYEYTKGEAENHTKISSKILKDLIPADAINAIKAHNYAHTGHAPIKSIDKALISADAVSGLIIATALILPTKKLSDIKLKTLKNKYRDKSFARGCDRERIGLCNEIGINGDEFLEISLNALKEISKELEF
jgi:putative nucleotidyltransferase with HDIG domain